MALAHSRPARARRHLTLVPPLSETETETETATESAPYGQPTYAGCPPYVHSIPTTAPTPDWSDHPPRKRVVWVRPYTDQETPDEEDTQP
ncbi:MULTISPECIES: hypothetical protein [unclassified Gordonia (in: high G+C Gram-positive bacteria)]|uniref:hypothetical protein n=1 Tax=unclassified Gordonia (in: high G+C Gram-positive bacteria) TaxID=2657482 RepID=UPI0025C3D8BF|nr:hypothetical protein [Gordonia sp. UBA7599]